MEDLHIRKKGRRRSLRNIRRSSSNFASANVACLEPNVLEDTTSGDVLTIIQSYGSAWLAGDENIDPLKALSKVPVNAQNKFQSFSDESCGKTIPSSSQDLKPFNPLSENQALESYVCGSPGGNFVSESPNSIRSHDPDVLKKFTSPEYSATVPDSRLGSNSSASDSLPEIDLSMYGSVGDCLAKYSPGFIDQQSNALANKVFSSPSFSDTSSHETLENLSLTDVKNVTYQETEVQERCSLNDAFIESNHHSRKNCDTQSYNMHRNVQSDTFYLGNNLELSQNSPLNDVEMLPCCENESVKETCSVPGPKIRKVSTESNTFCQSLDPIDDGISNDSRGSNSNTKASPNQSTSMLSAIQSLTLELEALSAISDSHENSTPTHFENVNLESKLESKNYNCNNENFSSEDLKNNISSKTCKDRKRLSLNRRSISAADSEEKQDRLSPAKNVSHSCSKLKEPLEQSVSVVDHEEKMEIDHLGTGSCNEVNSESLAQSTAAPVGVRECDLQNSAFEASEIEELSLRFANDGLCSNIKTHRKKDSSRRRSSRWFYQPRSDLDEQGVSVGERTSEISDPSLENHENNSSGDSVQRINFTGDQNNQPNLVKDCEEVKSGLIHCFPQTNEEVGEIKSCKRGRQKSRRRSAPVTYSGSNENDQMVNADCDNQVSENGNAFVLRPHEATDQIMITSFCETEKEKSNGSTSEKMDFTSSTLKDQEESNTECPQILQTDDADLRPLRRSTRSQRTCKRKSWVLPTAGKPASASDNIQTHGGRMGAQQTALSDCAEGKLDEDMDEFEVDEALRLLYLNKPYEAPPPTRSWETIKESPVHGEIFSVRCRPRHLNFEEKVSHTKWMKRHRKASMLYAVSQNQTATISDVEFQSKMEALDKLLVS